MNTRRQALFLRSLCTCACVLGMLSGGRAPARAASPPRVLLVTGRGVSDDAHEALGSAIAVDGEAVDPAEYQRLARSKGLLPTSDAALERVAPTVRAELIIFAHKAGGKLVLEYRDGGTGQLIHKESVAGGHRGKAAQLQARVTQSVHKMLASVDSSARAPRAAAAPMSNEAAVATPPTAAVSSVPEESSAELSNEETTPDTDPEPLAAEEPALAATSEAGHDRFLFELSAGVGGALRQSDLPTRLGEHQLSTGLAPGFAVGLRLGTQLGSHGMLRASADYRTSIGLQGVETQRATEMSTPLRSHGVGFGIEPGYRFGDAGSVSLLLHLGWYFRGLRPIAQLALPDMSWHAAVIRPELYISLADSAVTLRVAPELLVVAGLHTTLPDGSGIAHTGTGFGAEASVDIRVAAPLSLRIEYRESHVALSTAWAGKLTDVERFGALRVVLRY